MSDVLIDSSKLTAIADKIRALTGTSGELTLDQMNAMTTNPGAATITVSNITGGKRLTFTPASNCTLLYNTNGEPTITSSATVTSDILSVSSGTAQARSVNSIACKGSITSQAWSVSACEAPSITCVTNTSVTISCGTSGASIYYTIDGSIPTSSSTLYTAAFKPSSSCTVKAIAICNGYVNSSVSSAEYVVEFDGLKLTANTAGSTVTLSQTGTAPWSGYYSTDNGSTWNVYTVGTTGAITLSSAGDSVCFKGTLTAAQSSSNYLKFSMAGSIAGSGNIMSLCSGDGFASVTAIPYNYCFYYLFYGCTSLTSAPALPTITLKSNCYSGMFYGCTSLTAAPALLAVTLASSCYQSMFYNCTSLETSPELSATLANYCYSGMFYGCTSLTAAPALPATTLTNYCYRRMLRGCTSLTTAPALPATTLIQGCYYQMFYGCTALKVNNDGSSGALFFTCPSDTSPTDCISSMFASTGGTYTSDPVANGTYYYYDAALSVNSAYSATQSGETLNLE